MRFTKNFIHTRRDIAEDIESTNAKLLLKANFIKQELAGVYSYEPLGLRVLKKIEDIVRKHMDTVSTEVFMPSLHPMANWEKTNRLDKVDVLLKTVGANAASQEKNSQSYILGSTHEEIVTPLAGEFINSYQSLPVSLYQIQTKFRNEARAKSGLLRGREFRMKDLYSFHANEEDFVAYYDQMKKVYLELFAELGLGDSTFLTLASGGDFTEKFSHEFQVVVPAGEDTIYLDRANNIAYNDEILEEATFKAMNVDVEKLEKVRACEVGNIFPLESKFSNAFDIKYQDESGELQNVLMGCYGIGTSRVMGVIVEKFSDEKGMIWPENVAPFKYHLVTLGTSEEAWKKSEELYERFKGDILWDDRRESAGVKLNDADAIGIPNRIVVSEKSLAAGGYELKKRNEKESTIVSF
jgi:prolyl-tRNA synthetase